MKNLKRVLASFLIIMLMISIIACSTPSTDKGKEDEGVQAGETGGLDSSETDDLMTPYGKYPEAIEIHTAKSTSPAPNFVEGDTAEDNVETRYVLDKLNVKVVVDWEVEASEYINKLSLHLISDDLPDMFTIGPSDYLFYKQLLENDKLADLTESFDRCAGDFMKEVFDSFDNKNLEPYTEDGKLYGIASGQYGYEHNILWLRKDWLDEYDLPIPKTIDDIKNILMVFKDKNPGGSNVGMLLNATDPGGEYGSMYSATPIFEAFGATPKTWVKDSNGEIVYGSVMPEMKEGLKVLAEWYAGGLIDRQFATRTDDGANDALFNGSQSGIAFAPWWYAYVIGDLPHNNPNAEVIPVNAPLDSKGNYNISWPAPAGEAVFISKGYEHPEVVVKMLNVVNDMERGFDPEAAALFQPSLDANIDLGYMRPTGNVNLEYANILPDVALLTRNYIDKNLLEGAPTATEYDRTTAKSAKDYAETKSLDGMGWIEYHGRYLACSLFDIPEVKITYPVYSYSTDSMADLKPNLDTLESVAFLHIITGEKPVDYFDEFVEQWYAQGGEIITQEVRNAVK